LNPPASENGYIIVASESDFAWTNEIPVTRDWYRCGNEFYAQPLEEQLALRLYPIGIITLDTKEATLAYISNKIEIVKSMTSGISGKSKKGGQSQRRFEREREMEITNWFSRIGDASKVFVETYPIEELYISGCGQTKNKFLDGNHLDYRLKTKVKEVLDTQYTDESGIRETLHKALPILEKNAYVKEVKIVEDFFELLNKNFEKVVYGKEEIEKNLPMIIKFIKIEENPLNYNKETTILHFKGEHYDKIKSLGGIVGIRG
jgi:peptide chain release factor subunit 1